MPELLLEILSEEIPARMQKRAAEDLKRLVTDGLKSAGLDFDAADSYVTPRRLALVVDGLPDQTPDISEERRGPKTDAPEKAINGFLGSTGLTLDDLEKRETPKGEFYFAVIEKKGQATSDLLKELLEHPVFWASASSAQATSATTDATLATTRVRAPSMTAPFLPGQRGLRSW